LKRSASASNSPISASPTIALVIVFDLLEAENLKSKDLADEYPT
jgi:hypothetical protein